LKKCKNRSTKGTPLQVLAFANKMELALAIKKTTFLALAVFFPSSLVCLIVVKWF